MVPLLAREQGARSPGSARQHPAPGRDGAVGLFLPTPPLSPRAKVEPATSVRCSEGLFPGWHARCSLGAGCVPAMAPAFPEASDLGRCSRSRRLELGRWLPRAGISVCPWESRACSSWQLEITLADSGTAGCDQNRG